MFVVNSGPGCIVLKKYDAVKDKYGKVVKLLVASPRVTPDGIPTGKKDALLVTFRVSSNTTVAEMVNAIQANTCVPGDSVEFWGNLHTYDTSQGEEFDGGKQYAIVSGKSLVTKYLSRAEKRVHDWLNSKVAEEVAI